MKRFAIVLTTGIMLVVVTAGAGSAAPPNKTNVTLSCDRATIGATVVVTLKASDTGAESAAPVTLSCGSTGTLAKSERSVVVTGFSAGYVVVDQLSVGTPVENITCAAEGTLPLKLSCTDAAGGGAIVTIR
jgi:hypothetical protein